MSDTQGRDVSRSVPQLYRKKPLVIEAYRWFENGDHPEDNVGEILPDPLAGSGLTDSETYERLEGAVVRFYRNPEDSGARECEHCGRTMHDHGWIDTLEGGHNVCPGDWVITGIKGEHYPCKPDIFAATYEHVDPATLLERTADGGER